MALDGITIAAVVSDMKRLLVGGRIYKIYQPEVDEICMVVKNKVGEENITSRLAMSADASLPLIYITKQTKKNLQQITECFRANCANVVVESFNDEIKAMVGRKLKENFIKNVVWDIVSNRIKNGL